MLWPLLTFNLHLPAILPLAHVAASTLVSFLSHKKLSTFLALEVFAPFVPNAQDTFLRGLVKLTPSHASGISAKVSFAQQPSLYHHPVEAFHVQILPPPRALTPTLSFLSPQMQRLVQS